MEFTHIYDSTILLFFFVQGLVFAALLLVKGIRYSSQSSRLLSLFVFLCCLYVSPYMLGFANWYSRKPYSDILFYLPLQQLFLIGPILFFYTQSLLNKSFRFQKRDWLHFAPAIAYFIFSLIVFVVDKIILREYYFYADGRDMDLDLWYQITGFLSMSIYAGFSIQYYFEYKKAAFQEVSYADEILFDWVKKYLIAFFIIITLRLIFLVLFPNWGGFHNKKWYYFSFALLYYYIALTGYTNAVRSMLPFQFSIFNPSLEQSEQVPSIEISKEEPEHDSTPDERVEETVNEALKENIQNLITQEKLYENSLLTLSDLAKVLGTNPRVISNVVNQGFGVNFNDYINQHRIEAIKEQFSAGVHKERTLLAIALDCGFNSKTTFNRAFKKNTGLTPKKYLETITQEDNTVEDRG